MRYTDSLIITFMIGLVRFQNKMRITKNESNLKWSKELPTEPGDYLWVEQFSCGCVIKSGIAFVNEEGPHWEDQEPNSFEGKPIVDFWARIQLPNPEED